MNRKLSVLRRITAIVLCVTLLSLQVVIMSAEDIRKNITVSHESVCVMPYFICLERV